MTLRRGHGQGAGESAPAGTLGERTMVAPQPPPRYDEVFERGRVWLDSLAAPQPVLGILGVDVGFSAVGVALFLWGGSRWTVGRLRVVETKKSDRKGRVLAVEDNVRRVQEIGAALDAWRRDARIIALASEAFSPPRNSGVASKIGMMVGTLAELARANGLPFLQATPQTVKAAVTGSKSASKDDVETAVRRLYPETGPLLDAVCASKREHVADAVAAVHACLRAPEVEMVLRAVEAAA